MTFIASNGLYKQSVEEEIMAAWEQLQHGSMLSPKRFLREVWGASLPTNVSKRSFGLEMMVFQTLNLYVALVEPMFLRIELFWIQL